MAPASPTLRRELGLRDLVLFNISAILGIRWIASAAHAGPGSVSLWIAANFCFFIPSALVVAALARRYPGEGGLYVWARAAFGEWHGFLCAWCYWFAVLTFFPGLLVFFVSMAAEAMGEAGRGLTSTGAVVAISVVALWTVTLLNVRGLRLGKWLSNTGATAISTAAAILIALGLVHWLRGGSATTLDILPSWDADTVNFWPQLAFAFVGLELAAILGGEIRDPDRNIPRAALLSGAAVTFFYIAGTLAILATMRPEEVNVISGIAGAASLAGRQISFPAAGAVVALLVAVGAAGQIGTFMAGASRLPYVLGVDRFLPDSFARLHPRWGTPWYSLLWQGAFCSIFLLLMQAGENLRGAYQLLVDMAVITTLLPLVYMYAAAWRLVPRLRLAAASGLLVTLVGIALSFVPPAGVASVWLFELKLAGGTVVLLGAARWWYARCTRSGVR